MSDARSTAVIGVFTDHAQAQRAYEELKRSGFADAQIGYVARNGAAGENESGRERHRSETGDSARTGVHEDLEITISQRTKTSDHQRSNS